MPTLNELSRTIRKGDRVKAKELTEKALVEGIPPTEIITFGYITGMEDIGKQFGEGEVYLPEVLMSARAMKEAMALLLPILSESKFEPVGQLAIGTVKGDVHDIGKNIVTAVFTGSGFQVTDLGIDVPPERFVEAVEQGAQVIGMSALIGPTMPNMKVVIDAIEEAGLRSRVKIIIGGALVTQEFADKIGADAYAADAFSGVSKAKALLAG